MWGVKRIAIDLGTANAVVYVEGQGIVVQEPTVVVIDPKARKVIAVGSDALPMLGKVPEGIEVCRPLRHGSIAHYRATEALLKRFLARAAGRFQLARPEVVISVPAGLTSVEERAVSRALTAAGAGKIYLLPEPIAAALGAELPVHTSSGNMIVNLGGGTAEIAVISLNGIVTFASKKGAGDAVNESIMAYLKKNYQLIVGEQMAEKIKLNIGSLHTTQLNTDSMDVRGSHAKSGQPTSVRLDSAAIRPAIEQVMKEITVSIQKVLEKTPPELSSDIVDRGVVLSGGTALLKGIDSYLTRALGLPVVVADDPLLCVTRGLKIALENLDSFERSLSRG